MTTSAADSVAVATVAAAMSALQGHGLDAVTIVSAGAGAFLAAGSTAQSSSPWRALGRGIATVLLASVFGAAAETSMGGGAVGRSAYAGVISLLLLRLIALVDLHLPAVVSAAADAANSWLQRLGGKTGVPVDRGAPERGGQQDNGRDDTTPAKRSAP